MKIRMIVIIIVILAAFGGSAWFWLSRNAPASGTGNQNPFASTTSGSIGVGTPTVTVTAPDGSTYPVPDFRQGKKADTLPAGTYYHLTDNQTTQGPEAQFEIQYGTDNSITIVLLKEPLKAARLAAENSLRTFFPLPDEALCKLDVFVSVPASVNETFAGNNLGLSFCQSGTRLP